MVTRPAAATVWSRALVAGSFACFLGVAGHVMADGLLPALPWLVVLLGLSVVVSLPVLTRRASALSLVTLLVAGQTVIHLVLTVSAGHRGDVRPPAVAPRIDPGLTALPTVDGRRVGSLADAYTGTSDLTPVTPTLPLHHLVADLQAHAPMMVAHLVAAALVGLWLAHGERLLWTLVTLTGRRLLALVCVVLPVVTPPAHPSYAVRQAEPGPRSVWLARPHSRRGPPLLAL